MTKPTGFRVEFADFNPDDMPTIPEGFEDVSWHNDACPHFVNEAMGLGIWVDFKDPEYREYPDAPRFSVSTGEGDADFASVLATDDWAEVEAFIAERRKVAA